MNFYGRAIKTAAHWVAIYKSGESSNAICKNSWGWDSGTLQSPISLKSPKHPNFWGLIASLIDWWHIPRPQPFPQIVFLTATLYRLPMYKVNWWAPAITVVDVEHHDRDIFVLVVELPRLVVELRLHLQSILIKLVFSSILGTRHKRVVVLRIICPLLSRESWPSSGKSSPTNRKCHSRLRNKLIFAFAFMYLSLYWYRSLEKAMICKTLLEIFICSKIQH